MSGCRQPRKAIGIRSSSSARVSGTLRRRACAAVVPPPKERSDSFACTSSPALPRELRLREHPRIPDVRILLRSCPFVKRPGEHARKPSAFFAAAKTFPCFVVNSTPAPCCATPACRRRGRKITPRTSAKGPGRAKAAPVSADFAASSGTRPRHRCRGGASAHLRTGAVTCLIRLAARVRASTLRVSFDQGFPLGSIPDLGKGSAQHSHVRLLRVEHHQCRLGREIALDPPRAGDLPQRGFDRSAAAHSMHPEIVEPCAAVPRLRRRGGVGLTPEAIEDRHGLHASPHDVARRHVVSVAAKPRAWEREMACARQTYSFYSLVILPVRVHARVAHHEARRVT